MKYVSGIGHVVSVALSLCLASVSEAGTFDLFEVRVQGNSVLDQRTIEATVYPHLGEKVDESVVETIRAALERTYRERGFTTIGVVVPEQRLSDGILRVDVVEQRVDRLRVKGSRYFSHRDIVDAVPSLAPGTVLNSNAVQEDLDALSRRSADRTIQPVIRTGRTPGTLDVELRVKDELPLHASVELNNFSSPNTESLRASGTVSYGNLFQRQDRLMFSYQTTPEDRQNVKVTSLAYVYRPRELPGIYSLTAVDSESDVAAVADTAFVGSGRFLIGRAVYPLRAEASAQDTLLVGFDHKDSDDVTRFRRDVSEGVVSEEVDEKQIEYVNLVAGYSGGRQHLGGVSYFGLSANLGVRQLGNERNEFEEKRFKGEPNYFYLEYELGRRQDLPMGLTADASLAGQFTGDALLGSEQMVLGGFRSVRGYLEAEELADYGVVLRTELGRAVGLADGLLMLRPFVFWDWGKGRLVEPLPDETADLTLSSAGLGLRLDSWRGLTAEALWALALESASDTVEHDSNVSFRINYQY